MKFILYVAKQKILIRTFNGSSQLSGDLIKLSIDFG